MSYTNKGKFTMIRLVLAGLLASAIALVAAIPILLMAIPFWLVSRLTQALLPLFKPTVLQWPELFEFHPLLGWKAKANFSAHFLEARDDVFHVDTGSDGWAGHRTITDSKVVVFGDSYAFGYGVDTNRAFFEVAEVPVKSVGAPGYNMVQELLLLEEMASSLKGKIVVWFACYSNDLYDNLAPEMGGYRTPFVAQAGDGEWRIETRHIDPSKWSVSSGRQGRQRMRVPEKLFKKSYLGDRAFLACEFLIGRGRDICRSAGAEFIVLTIPTPAMLDPSPAVFGKSIDAEHPDMMIRSICKKLGVQVICLKDILKRDDYKPYDEHWNERGHRKVARIIANLYRDKSKLINQIQHENSLVKKAPLLVPEVFRSFVNPW